MPTILCLVTKYWDRARLGRKVPEMTQVGKASQGSASLTCTHSLMHKTPYSSATIKALPITSNLSLSQSTGWVGPAFSSLVLSPLPRKPSTASRPQGGEDKEHFPTCHQETGFNIYEQRDSHPHLELGFSLWEGKQWKIFALYCNN